MLWNQLPNDIKEANFPAVVYMRSLHSLVLYLCSMCILVTNNYLSILSIYLSIYLSIHLSIYLMCSWYQNQLELTGPGAGHIPRPFMDKDRIVLFLCTL